MIFLSDNVLVERDITAADIRPRLLGNCSVGWLRDGSIELNDLH